MEILSSTVAFARAFLATGLWCDVDNCLGNDTNQTFVINDIADISIHNAEIICQNFLNNNPEACNFPYETVATDLWLSQNGHGSGFWDREELYGVELAEKFHKYTKEKMIQKDLTYYEGKLFLE